MVSVIVSGKMGLIDVGEVKGVVIDIANSTNRHVAKYTDNQHISPSNLRNKSNSTSALGKTSQLLCTVFAGSKTDQRLSIVFDHERASRRS